MKKMLRALCTLTLAVSVTAVMGSPVQAAPSSSSPVAICRDLAANNPDLYGFIATKPGGCVSTVASVGLDALAEGAFPSRAAAVGNCKFLEAMSFFRDPAPAKVYPYTFHGELRDIEVLMTEFGLTEAQAERVAAAYEANLDAFTANNRAGCVRVLKGLHSGQLFGLVLGAAGAP